MAIFFYNYRVVCVRGERTGGAASRRSPAYMTGYMATVSVSVKMYSGNALPYNKPFDNHAVV